MDAVNEIYMLPYRESNEMPILQAVAIPTELSRVIKNEERRKEEGK
jgi:hypothetical protein